MGEGWPGQSLWRFTPDEFTQTLINRNWRLVGSLLFQLQTVSGLISNFREQKHLFRRNLDMYGPSLPRIASLLERGVSSVLLQLLED